MAAQCRSPRCTAERKGFRRELDSWRHRLIHCVGFESILEGLYGSGLRKDLSLFDDCEPEELFDWCVDDKCSLCNLRKDTDDYTPSGGSAQSTPTGELISQGQFDTEKTECQAENYLNALFQKKDLPQNCDPNIPLVAQELMKKMIRQFAIEYVSKSREMYPDSNGTIADDPLGCNGIKKRQTDSLFLDEQDGPLDLTVTRIQEQTFQDGVLDLSIKRHGSAFEENSKTRNSKNCVMNGYFLRKMKKSAKIHKESTALFKVLASWCLYHQQQLMGMLKFLKKEQESCSRTCHSSAQSPSAKRISRSSNTSLVTCQICTNQKSTKRVEINERQMHVPYLAVCLKDLRFTWPNLNLGTVKVNLNKKEDVCLGDQLLHYVNTSSKEKKQSVRFGCLNCHQSTNQTIPPLSKKVQRTVPILKSTMIKHGLQCRCIQSVCHLEMTSNCCPPNGDASDGSYKTAIKTVTFKESSFGNGKQNRVQLNRKDKQKKCLASSTSSRVNFGSLIKHFLTSETNSFAELLNQKENISKKYVQTGSLRKNEKMSIFDSPVSDCQTIDFARKLNYLTDTFPMEKNNFVKKSPNSIDDGITVSVENQAYDVLVLKDCESTKTKCELLEKITNLPRDTLKIRVNCVRNSQLCLPANLKHSVPQRIVNEKLRGNKRHTDQDVQDESTIPPKRYSRNTLGKCNLCDSSRGICSFQDDNLFCKCTIQKNSGIIKNFKAGVMTRSTTEKNRNPHLKVVVERLEDSKLSANSTVNCKDLCKSNLRNSEVKASSYVLNVLQKTLNNVKQSNCLNPTLVAQANYASVESTHKSISEGATSTTSSANSYFSPIKLMFVSKVENEDGIKYTLSSEYTPVNNDLDVELCNSVVETRKASHSYHPNRLESRFCKNIALVSLPECKLTAQNSPAKLSYCSDQSHFERRISRRKTRPCQVSRHIEGSSESQHKRCSQKTFTRAGNDILLCPNKTAKSKELSSKLEKSTIAETYIQKKGSGNRLRIKKVERLRRSFERNLHNSESLNFQRVSKCHKLRKLSNISGICKSSGCISQEGGQDLLSPFPKAITQYTEKEVDRAEQDQNQSTITKRKWTPGSLRIGKHNLSISKTRSGKLLATSFSSVTSCDFSVSRALCHKSKKLHLSKCRVYERRLRSYKPPLMDPKCTGNTAKNDTANIDLQPNTVEGWSTSTSKESLLKDFERKYEQIANTWLGENNGEKYNEEQSLSALKCCSSEMRSPVQMLFQKKCDIGELAAWFMQTTETQSLSIVRKANAQNPLRKINRKRLAKKPSINSCQSKKNFKKCAPSTDTLTEVFNVSKASTEKCKVGQNPNNLQSMIDQSQDVCVKFACAGSHVDVTNACTRKTSTTSKEMTLSTNIDVRSAVCHGAAAIPSSIDHIDSLGSSKQKMLVQNKTKTKAKNVYMCRSSKQNIRDCRVFLTKLGDGESKMSHSGNSIRGSNSKSIPQWKLKRSFTAKYCLQMNKSLARSPSTVTAIKNSTSKECNFGMCLRKSKGSAAPYARPSRSSILKRRNQLPKMTLFVESNTKRSKPQIPNMGKLQSQWPKFHLGPIKSVGIPAIRGLSSKGGTYSLTPIRIPLQ